jgi:arylsulfatase A-like enzyme/tetratricopeptide (TPR) repeat protein
VVTRPSSLSGWRRRWPIIAGAVAAAGAAAVLWLWPSRATTPAAGPAAGARPNVLLVTIDTLRADRAVAGLMPNLAALAARGSAFTNARTMAPLTLPAHASLMTGLLPPRAGVRLNGVHRLAATTPTLASILRGVGYRSAAIVGAFVLDKRFGLGEGFETYDDEIARRDEAAGSLEAERPANVVADRAVSWLAARPAGAEPFFLWVHFYDPHAPYTPPEQWRTRAGGVAYDGEVAFADAQLGRVLEALHATGVTDRTLIVVAGDHGESLGDHGEATHGLLLYEAALRVPLVIAGPRVPAAIRGDAVSLVDVMPSVLDRVGLETPSNLDGRSVFQVPAAGATRDMYAETQYPELAGCSALRMCLDGRWKFIGGPADRELYDLESDPAEQRNLAASRRALVEAMSARAAKVAEAATPSTPASPDPDVVERLRALGYLATAPATSAGTSARPSPVTIVRDWSRLEAAMEDLAAGRRDRALATLAALAHARPEAPAFQSTYARVLLDAGDATAALGVYRDAVRRWPQDAALLHGLAAAARDAGRADEAMKAELAALAVDRSHAPALNGLGLLHADAGRAAEARAAFERAVAIDPYAVSYRNNLGNALMASDDLATAEREYRESLRLDPASPDAANGLGVVLVKTRRAAEAVPLFARVVAASPAFYDAWLNLGIARQETGDRAAAAAAYRRVLAAPPRFAAQRSAAAQLLAALGEAR